MPAPQPPSGLRLTVTDDLDRLHADFAVKVEQRLHDGDWWTLRQFTWSGLEVDLLTTLAEDLMGAYLYGDGPLSIPMAFDSVWRVAKSHAQRHRYS